MDDKDKGWLLIQLHVIRCSECRSRIKDILSCIHPRKKEAK